MNSRSIKRAKIRTSELSFHLPTITFKPFMRATTIVVALALAFSASAADNSEQHSKRSPTGCGNQSGLINVAALNQYGCSGNISGGCGNQKNALINVAALNNYNCVNSADSNGPWGSLPFGLGLKEDKHAEKA